MNLPMCVHRKSVTEKNPGVVVVAFGGNDAGNWDRCFRSKSIEVDPVLSRSMLPEEIEVYQASWRMRWVEYASWERLIRDEWKLTNDMIWCGRIHTVGGVITPLQKILGVETQINNQVTLF
jgi:hypothetical protein